MSSNRRRSALGRDALRSSRPPSKSIAAEAAPTTRPPVGAPLGAMLCGLLDLPRKASRPRPLLQRGRPQERPWARCSAAFSTSLKKHRGRGRSYNAVARRSALGRDALWPSRPSPKSIAAEAAPTTRSPAGTPLGAMLCGLLDLPRKASRPRPLLQREEGQASAQRAHSPCTSSVCACGWNPSALARCSSWVTTSRSSSSTALWQRSQIRNGTECCALFG